MLVKLQKSRGLRQRAYEVLRRQISAGRIKPGQRLIENSLAEALGISRTPVREALALLARDGLLVPTTRGFVLPTFTEHDVAEIYALRRLLEPAAFGDAVEHATPQGLAAMRGRLADQRAAHARDDLAAFAAGNSAFRQAWLDLVTNRRLVASVALYNDHVQILRVRLRVRSVRKIVISGMVEMLKAAERRDKSAAVAAITKHIAAAEIESRILVREQAGNAGEAPEISNAA
jgi:DNA-binding GntR family transcriptional regulator